MKTKDIWSEKQLIMAKEIMLINSSLETVSELLGVVEVMAILIGATSSGSVDSLGRSGQRSEKATWSPLQLLYLTSSVLQLAMGCR